MRRWWAAAIVLMLALATFERDTGAQAPVSSRRYRIIDLGTLGGYFSRARAINNRGEIAGESLMSDNADVTAFYWQGGQMHQIAPYVFGSLGFSSGAAINESGVIAGHYDPSQFPPNPPAQAFRYDSATSTFELLGVGRAVDINGAGQTLVGVGGQSFIVGGANLPSFHGTSLNARGEVVGYSSVVGSGSFLYQQGQFVPISDSAFQPSDVNDSRQIVGSVLVNLGLFGNRSRVRLMQYDTNWPPAITTVLTYAPLDFLGTSVAGAINNVGQIVGTESRIVSGRSVKTAFIIENSVVRRLSDFLPPNSGWVLEGDFGEANDINDRGEIVGTGLINGEWHGFLMTPLVCSNLEDIDGDGNPDNDGDDLCDSWETDGVDGDGDGTIDLVLPGANVNRKDLYVEIDYMVSFAGGHGHRPQDEALTKVVDAFANLPVLNPDLSFGVTLHLEVDDFVPEIEPIIFRGPGQGTPTTSTISSVAVSPIPAAPEPPGSLERLRTALTRVAWRFCRRASWCTDMPFSGTTMPTISVRAASRSSAETTSWSRWAAGPRTAFAMAAARWIWTPRESKSKLVRSCTSSGTRWGCVTVAEMRSTANRIT